MRAEPHAGSARRRMPAARACQLARAELFARRSGCFSCSAPLLSAVQAWKQELKAENGCSQQATSNSPFKLLDLGRENTEERILNRVRCAGALHLVQSASLGTE